MVLDKQLFRNYNELRSLIMCCYKDISILKAYEELQSKQNDSYTMAYNVSNHFISVTQKDLALTLWKTYCDTDPHANIVPQFRNAINELLRHNGCGDKQVKPKKINKGIENKLKTMRNQFLAHTDMTRNNSTIEISELKEMLDTICEDFNEACDAAGDNRISGVSEKDVCWQDMVCYPELLLLYECDENLQKKDVKHEKIQIDDDIFGFVYIESMRDAVIQLAYKGKKKKLEESCVLKSLKGKVEPLIDKVLNNEYLSQDEYDEDFLNTTISVCKCINDIMGNDEFTFGNAQKFINIMLKHFYIASYKDTALKERFRFCHCPMDHRLLKNVWDNRATLGSDIVLGKYEDFLKSWGNEGFETGKNGEKGLPERYRLFQEAVRYLADKEGINPLEFDFREWK